VVDSRAGMDSGLEPFNESFYMPLMLFRCHFPRNRSPNYCHDNCAFECTGSVALMKKTNSWAENFIERRFDSRAEANSKLR
jgi:hypothetical protein